MLDELVAQLPHVDDLLALTAPQIDGILLRCIAKRATSTDPTAAKHVFEDEIVGWQNTVDEFNPIRGSGKGRRTRVSS